MAQYKALESQSESVAPESGRRRRSTLPALSAPAVAVEQRTTTQPGLSAPPPAPPASERVLRAAGLGPRPVRAPR